MTGRFTPPRNRNTLSLKLTPETHAAIYDFADTLETSPSWVMSKLFERYKHDLASYIANSGIVPPMGQPGDRRRLRKLSCDRTPQRRKEDSVRQKRYHARKREANRRLFSVMYEKKQKR